MVAPLFVISLVWERYDWRASQIFRPRTFTWRVGHVQRTLSGSTLASSLLLAVISGMLIWVGLASRSMPALSGWQEQLAASLQHGGSQLTHAFAWLPGWLGALLVLAAIGLLARRAWQQLTPPIPDAPQAQPATPEQTITHDLPEEAHV